jgi:hypothetical protein
VLLGIGRSLFFVSGPIIRFQRQLIEVRLVPIFIILRLWNGDGETCRSHHFNTPKVGRMVGRLGNFSRIRPKKAGRGWHHRKHAIRPS